jgi:hypothetical protein
MSRCSATTTRTPNDDEREGAPHLGRRPCERVRLALRSRRRKRASAMSRMRAAGRSTSSS